MNTPHKTLLALFAGFVVPLCSAATINIVNETFADGDRATTTKVGDTYTSLAWWNSSNTAGAVTATTGAMTLSSLNSGRHTVGQFDTLSLAVGESLKLSFNATFTGISASSNADVAFRFGLFDSNLTYTYDGDNPNTSTATGYVVGIKPYQSATQMSVKYGDRPATANYLLTTTQPHSFTTNNNVPGPLANATSYTFGLNIERITETTVTVTYSIAIGNNTPFFNANPTKLESVSFTSFDTIAFSLFDNALNAGIDTVTLSNISLVHTSNIPEPGAFASLAGAGALAAAFAGRRRR